MRGQRHPDHHCKDVSLVACYLLLATCCLLPDPSLDTGRVWVMVRGSARERTSPASGASECRTVKLGEEGEVLEVVEVEVEVLKVLEVLEEDCRRSTSSS